MAYRGTPLVSLRLDPEIRRALDQICAENKISISDAIRLAILDFLDKNKTDAP